MPKKKKPIVTVRTTWTREDGQTFPVLISEDGMEDWLANRAQLQRRGGYPDRPPDIDTETLRQWVMHPGFEQAMLSESALERSRNVMPVKTITTTWGSTASKLIIERIAPRRYRARIGVLNTESGEQPMREYEGGWQMRRNVEAAYKLANEAFSAMAGEPDGQLVTTEADIKATMKLHEATIEAVQDWYAKRGPTQ